MTSCTHFKMLRQTDLRSPLHAAKNTKWHTTRPTLCVCDSEYIHLKKCVCSAHSQQYSPKRCSRAATQPYAKAFFPLHLNIYYIHFSTKKFSPTYKIFHQVFYTAFLTQKFILILKYKIFSKCFISHFQLRNFFQSIKFSPMFLFSFSIQKFSHKLYNPFGSQKFYFRYEIQFIAQF